MGSPQQRGRFSTLADGGWQQEEVALREEW